MSRRRPQVSVTDRETYQTHQQSPAAGAVEISIEVEAGANVERVWRSTDHAAVRIGAHPGCDIVLEDQAVSRVHCEIRAVGGRWQLIDLGSTNGTVLNGVRVRDVDVPTHPSRLEIGGSALRVVTHGPAPAPPSFGLAFGAILGGAPAIQRVFALIDRVSRTDTDVLIEGESGTGKELVAAEIVRRSSRKAEPFVVVDCGALSPTLVESELFGHVRGAFTGADKDRAGAFEIAAGGTVFLDEIGELPLELQPKLLRVLAQREVRRLGEVKPRKVDVRVLAATNRRLEREVNQGHFREDLFFRLAVIRIEIPPLRDRAEDLMLLLGSFLDQMGRPDLISRLTPDVVERLRRYEWPGNVRELRNWVERFVVLEAQDVPDGRPTGRSTAPTSGDASASSAIDLSRPFSEAKALSVNEFERSYLAKLMDAAGNNISKAARIAKMDRMYLHRLLQRHDLRRGGALD
jgi:transcriptional regulator with GAF, ATPase, and Fis domain